MIKQGDTVETRLKACIFPKDNSPSIMASKGIIGTVRRGSRGSDNWIVDFVLDGKEYDSNFAEHELEVIDAV